MPKKMFKCFVCGKVYGEEDAARRCHNAPIQKMKDGEQAQKPRFLGR